MGVLVREIAALYTAYHEGQSSPLEELPIQYADYAAWERQRLSEEVLDEQLSYWKKRLAGVPEALAPIAASVRGQQLALELALRRGLDPDAPRGLNKVTETR